MIYSLILNSFKAEQSLRGDYSCYSKVHILVSRVFRALALLQKKPVFLYAKGLSLLTFIFKEMWFCPTLVTWTCSLDLQFRLC